MGFRKFILIFLITVFSIISPAFAENYLIGMTISKFNEHNYIVSLQMQNDTEKQYIAKDIGNNSYVIMMPQIKSIMEKSNIEFNDENPDINVYVSESKSFKNQDKFYTKIKFVTPTFARIQVQTYGKNSANEPLKTSEIKKKLEKKEKKESQTTNIPEWLWYLPIALIVLSLFIFQFNKKSEKEEKQKTIVTLNKVIPITERNKEIFENAKNLKNKGSLKEFQQKKEIEKQQKDIENFDENHIPTEEETDKVIDDLVKVVISKNDLVLMPGVPELYGLDNKKKKSKNTKSVLKNVKIDLYDVENFDKQEEKIEEEQKDEIKEEKIEEESLTSLSYRLKNKELLQESEDTIVEEKAEILENISSINDIFAENIIEEEPDNEDEYDNLIKAFKKSLTIAHKIKENENPTVDVVDAFAIDENRGFSLVKMGEKTSLVGNIGEKIFVIKTFTDEEINNDTLFMEFCTQTPTYQSYSVILNKFKALIKVSQTEISLIGTYN